VSREPNVLDKLVARILCGELPLELVLILVAAASCVASVRLDEYEYLQECLVELSIGCAFFLAIYLVRVEKLTVAVAVTVLIGGGLLGLSGFFVQPTIPLLAAYLLKLASAIVLFVLVEQIIRGILLKAEASRGRWEQTVQLKRQAAVAKVRKAGTAAVEAGTEAVEAAGVVAAIGVIMVAGTILDAGGSGIKVAYEDEAGRHNPMEGPDLPESLFADDAFDIPWSMTGIFNRTPDIDDETAAARAAFLAQDRAPE